MKNNFKENNEFIDYNHDHRDTVSLWNLLGYRWEVERVQITRFGKIKKGIETLTIKQIIIWAVGYRMSNLF